jgi:hypothetical protein
MQKSNFEDTKGIFGSRKSNDRQYNDQMNNINCITMANDTYPC